MSPEYRMGSVHDIDLVTAARMASDGQENENNDALGQHRKLLLEQLIA